MLDRIKALVLLFLAVGLSFLTGCWSIDRVVADRTPYWISEGGTPKQFYAVQVTEHNLLVPVLGGAPLVLLDSPQPSKFGLHTRIHLLPEWRHVDTLQALGERMAPPYPPEGRGEETPIRWVVGMKPLVVAVGTQKMVLEWGSSFIRDGKLELPNAVAMVREEDLASTATALIVLDQWPNPWPPAHDMHYWDDVKAFVDAHKRIINLDRPTTLWELMTTRSWEKVGSGNAERIN